MGKYIAVFSGLTGFGMLALFFLFLGWKEYSADQKKEIESNIHFYTELWEKKSSPITIQYDSMDASGFPFRHEIKLFQPRIQFTTHNEIIQLSSLLLTFLPKAVQKGETVMWRYKVEFPLEVVVSVKPVGGKQRNFTVHLTEIPGMFLQAQSAIRSGHFDEYGILMPEKLMMTLNREQETKMLNFNFTEMDKPYWRYIPDDVHGEVIHFIHALEASLNEQPQ